jgi:hypothetical protein
MTQIQTQNNLENQNMLLTKSRNFLNSQNYILGKSEKKKVLTSFMWTKILKKVLGYTSIVYSILFAWVSFYIFSSFQKYKIVKLFPNNTSILNFVEILESNKFSNWFYEVSKK